MQADERNERHGFRFFNVSEREADQLRKICPQVQLRIVKRGEQLQRVASFWLDANADYSWLHGFIVEHQFSADSYGFFISVRTESDTGIVRAPEFVVRLIREMGGVLDFSFTVV